MKKVVFLLRTGQVQEEILVIKNQVENLEVEDEIVLSAWNMMLNLMSIDTRWGSTEKGCNNNTNLFGAKGRRDQMHDPLSYQPT